MENVTIKKKFPKTTIRNFRTVQKEGYREVCGNVEFYNLDVIIEMVFEVIQPELFNSDNGL